MSLDLHGLWRLSAGSGLYDCAMTLPGDGITALHTAGLIPDPYFGRNEYDLRWISQTDWVIARDVVLDDTPQELVLEGLDTLAEVWLNGRRLAQFDNAFRTHRVALTGANVGANRLELRFPELIPELNRRQDAQPFPVPYHQPNCPLPNGNMIRKPQCDFGWDWNVALAPFGVWGRVALEAPGPRLAGLVVDQRLVGPAVTLEVSAHLTGYQGAVMLSLCGQQVQAQADGGIARFALTVEDAALWWPAGLGPQTLHDLTLTFGAGSETRRIGLRALDLVTESDAAGLGFKFRVNGHDTFARGANWIPADALHGRISRDGVRDLLQSAVDAHMNMIRVWGGGRYEPDWFYDLCDELGLMVWQDFMFACHLYPADPGFLAEIEAEVRETVLRIGHHASLALWCGDNELIGALGWFEESRRDRDRYLVAYDRLNRTVEAGLKAVAPKANWWPSSPSPGPLSFGDAWHNDASGDMHFWSVWHEGRDFAHYRDVRPRFCSEFGFQSYPSMEVVARFAAPEDWNIAAPVLESHQKNTGGNARIAETMFRYFRFPASFPDFVWLSQIQQGLAIKTAVTAWRSLKPHCMGALYWQLNDTWPVCSWSSLDHGGGWKLMHHMAQGFYAPVTLVAVPTDTGFALRGVNDGRDATDLALEVFALSLDGALRPLVQAQARLGPDAAEPLADVPPLAADELLYWRWSGPAGTGEDHLAPNPYKSYDLLPSGLDVTARAISGGYALTLTARRLSLFATVQSDRPGRFSHNALTVLPGQSVQITFTPKDAGDTPHFTTTDLHRATYGARP